MSTTPFVVATVLFIMAFAALVPLTGCDSGWSGVHREAGPLPLSSLDKPILRLVDRRTTFEVGEQKRLYWDEGNGPIPAGDRIKPVLESIPKELSDRLHATRNVPMKLYPAYQNREGTTYQYICDTWAMVVSLNPDVLVISVRETPIGPHPQLPRSWDRYHMEKPRREHLDKRVEYITGSLEFRVYGGTLVPWSEEMHVFSPDPGVKSGRLAFENSRAEVPLPVGRLLLVRHDDDVDVIRE